MLIFVSKMSFISIFFNFTDTDLVIVVVYFLLAFTINKYLQSTYFMPGTNSEFFRDSMGEEKAPALK